MGVIVHKSNTETNGCKKTRKFSWQIAVKQRLLAGLITLLWAGGSVHAAETRVIVADPTLSAGPVHRLFLGADYRDLWTTPVEIEVLDLSLIHISEPTRPY